MTTQGWYVQGSVLIFYIFKLSHPINLEAMPSHQFKAFHEKSTVVNLTEYEDLKVTLKWIKVLNKAFSSKRKCTIYSNLAFY